MPRRPAPVWLLLTLVCAFTRATPIAAQTVRGWVIDDANGQRIKGASVSVLHVVSDTVLAVRITDDMPFTIFMRQAGNYRLRVEAFGYTPLTTEPIRLVDETVMSLELRVRANAIALSPLRVVAERTEAPFMREVRVRQASGFGTVLTREEIETSAGSKLSDLLQTVPGLRIQNAGAGGQTIPLVETRAATTMNRACFASLYLNGVRQFEARPGDDGELDPVALARAEDLATLSASEIEAIEIYRGAADLPAAFSGSTSQCGVIAIWTRTGYDPPIAIRDRPQLHINLAGVGSHLAGELAPGSAAGAEVGLYWESSASAMIGFRLLYAEHTLPASATAELTNRLDPGAYALPPGARAMPLYVGGLEARFVVMDRFPLRGLVSGRANYARRSFIVNHAAAGSRKFQSNGFGLGGSAGAEYAFSSRLTAGTTVAYDALFFNSYDNLGRPNDPTSATWRNLSLRVGLSFIAVRERAH